MNGGALAELVPLSHTPFPTPWYEFAYTPSSGIALTQVGTWFVEWDGVNPVNINGVINMTERTMDRLVIKLPGDTALWNYLNGMPADEPMTLRLRGGPQITSPFPTTAQQLAGYQAVVDPDENREFYLRFQKQHATFTALYGSHKLEFDWYVLSGYAGGGSFL